MQKENQFKIIEFFDFKGRCDRMLEEMDAFLLLLIEDGAFKDVEDNLMWLVNHKGVTPEQKLGFAARIHEIDQFYNPYTKIEKVFSMMLEFQGTERPYSPGLLNIANKVLAFLER